MATNLKGLQNFRDKLEKNKQMFSQFGSKFSNAYIDDVLKLGVQEAQKQYQETGISDVKVYSEKTDSHSGRIVAEKKGIAYIEFGTGTMGKTSGYNSKKLPKEGVPLTGKWKYNYDSEHKVVVDGKIGWYLNGNFTEGQPAGKQMYKTSMAVKRKAKQIFRNKVKGVKTDV